MNSADKISKMFYARRDEKRQQLVGKDSPRIREIGLFRSVPARKKFRREN